MAFDFSEHPQNSESCRQYASFFGQISDGLPVLLFFILHILTAILTAWLRSVTPGVGDAKPAAVPTTTPATGDVEATAIPSTVEAAADGPAADEPPPYQPPSTETVTPAPQMPKVKRSSAHSFVMGSCIFIALLTSITFLALDIQAIIFCESFSPVSTVPRVIFWIFYGLMCMWASTGVSCWMMLFRDLWGPAAKKKYPITEAFFFTWVFALPMTPFVVLGMGLVNAIEACQKRFCSEALEEEEEDAEQGTELGQRSGSNVEDGEGSGSREEESVGLISAMK